MYFDRQTAAALSKILHDFIGSYAEEKKKLLGVIWEEPHSV